MLKWLALALVLVAFPAWAQTTTFGVTGYPCHAAITVSGGGLTLTSSAASGDKFCLANVGKYIADVYNSGAGLFYYTFTPSGTVNAPAYGFDSAPAIPTTLTATSNVVLGLGYPDNYSAGYRSSTGTISWVSNSLATGMGAAASGATGAVVVNLNTDAAEMWVTPNIATLSCNGSGGSGSTRPKWNGSCTKDPSIPGSGTPTSGGTGANVFMQGAQFFPAVTLAANDATTLSFATNATLGGYLPAGYVAWNDSTGSACSFPCPTDTVTVNIANAPRYSNSATMTRGNAAAHTVASRIVAGPGCTKTAWTPGSSCWLWQATNSGTTTSSGDPTGSWTCGSPAGYGGFYGTSFPGASTQIDNGITFACLVAIDYPSITEAAIDTGTTWAAGTGSCTVHGPGCYWQQEVVRNAGNIYTNIQSNFTPPYLCVSAGVAPTGTGTITDGTCTWYYTITPTYASRSPPYWTQSNFTGPGPAEMTYMHHTNVRIWGGGHEVTQYVAGTGGEADPISLRRHQGQFSESVSSCLHGYNSQQISNAPNCVGQFLIENVGPAPGDGFADNMVATDKLQPSATYGVKLYNSGSNAGLLVYDAGLQLHGLIVQSVSGNGVDGALTGNFTNLSYFYNLIVEAGGPSVVSADAGAALSNSLIILDSAAPAGSIAVFMKYPALISYNTIVCSPGLTNSTALGFYAGGATPYYWGTNEPWVGNAYFGCVNPWAAGGTGTGWDTKTFANNAANATDILSSYTDGIVFTAAGTGTSLTTYKIVGTTYNLTASANLINPTIGSSFDARIKATSAYLYGNGASYSFAPSWGDPTLGGGVFFPLGGTATPGADIFNVSRPVSGRYDIGAGMYVQVPMSAGTGVGRRWGR